MLHIFIFLMLLWMDIFLDFHPTVKYLNSWQFLKILLTFPDNQKEEAQNRMMQRLELLYIFRFKGRSTLYTFFIVS